MKKSSLNLLALFVVHHVVVICNKIDDTVEGNHFVDVKTNYGMLRGYQLKGKATSHVPVNAFLGVPFAKPPIESLRFEVHINLKHSKKNLHTFREVK